MAKEKITIYDVAREAGVSMATVSRVVNGNPNVRKSTREKVEEVIKRLNYQPNAVARGLASNRTTTIGVLIPDTTDMFYAALALGIDDIASMYKYNIFMANIDKKSSDVTSATLNAMLAKQVDGIIFMNYEMSDDYRDRLLQAETPTVLAGTVDLKQDFPTVHIDYKQATKDAFRFFIDSGHEKIAFITDDRYTDVNEKLRLAGYQEIMDGAGLDHYIYRVPETHVIEEAVLQDIIGNGISAALTTSDEIGIGLSNGLQDLGVSIPNDFEIITSSNTKISEVSRPTLTTIVQPLYDIGAVSMRLLTKLMNDEEVENLQTILPHSIEYRGSTQNK